MTTATREARDGEMVEALASSLVDTFDRYGVQLEAGQMARVLARVSAEFSARQVGVPSVEDLVKEIKQSSDESLWVNDPKLVETIDADFVNSVRQASKVAMLRKLGLEPLPTTGAVPA